MFIPYCTCPTVCPSKTSPLFSQRCKLPLQQLLSFDNHLNCPGVGLATGSSPHRPYFRCPVLSMTSALFCTSAKLNPFSFNTFHTLYQDTRGVPSEASASQGALPHLSTRQPANFQPANVQTQEPLIPTPHGGTIFSAGHFPLSPVSNFPERTTGSQHVGQDRRPGPPAIRSRNPVHVLRPRKASSVRLGQRSIVGP